MAARRGWGLVLGSIVLTMHKTCCFCFFQFMFWKLFYLYRFKCVLVSCIFKLLRSFIDFFKVLIKCIILKVLTNTIHVNTTSKNAVKLDFNHTFILNPFCHSPFNDIPVWMPRHLFTLHLKGASLYPMLEHKLSIDQITVGQMTEITF